jgi:CubicO group peptidase (beta-lactamase class C family)
MALAGPIIRRAGGVPYRQWMHDRVLAPLGMASAGWERAELPAERVATGNLVTRDDAGVHLRPSLSEWRMGAAESFGGLYASIDDMVRFARFELTGAGPLSVSSVAESQAPAIEVPGEARGTRYGVCWRLEVERGLVRHGGATDEYGAAIAIDHRKGAAAVLLSTAPFAAELEAAAAALLQTA